MGCLDVIIDSDIIFLLVSILRPHYFNLLKTALRWRVFISQEIEEEIEDPVSSSVKEKLLKEGVWEHFTPSSLEQAKEIIRRYKDLRKIIHKGEASCYAIAYCAGFSVLSHDHEANRLLPVKKIPWMLPVQSCTGFASIKILERKSAGFDCKLKKILCLLTEGPHFC